MTISDTIADKIKELPTAAQQEVLDFVDFLILRTKSPTERSTQASPSPKNSFELHIPKTPLGKKLHDIRQRAIASGMRLVPVEEIESEMFGN